MRTRVFPSLSAICAIVVLSAAPASAQPAALQTFRLNAAEIATVQKATQANARIRSLLGAGAMLSATSSADSDKADALDFLTGKRTAPPERYVTMTLFNPQTRKAVLARVRVSDSTIVSSEAISLRDVPIFEEEASQAVALARGDAKVRAAIGATVDRFQFRPSGDETKMPFAAEILPLLGNNEKDPCFNDRCVEVLFRTEAGYLPLRAQVDLSSRAVTLIAPQRTEMHQGMGQ